MPKKEIERKSKNIETWSIKCWSIFFSEIIGSYLKFKCILVVYFHEKADWHEEVSQPSNIGKSFIDCFVFYCVEILLHTFFQRYSILWLARCSNLWISLNTFLDEYSWWFLLEIVNWKRPNMLLLSNIVLAYMYSWYFIGRTMKFLGF